MKKLICILLACASAFAVWVNPDEVRAQKYGIDDYKTFLLNTDEYHRKSESTTYIYRDEPIRAYRIFVNIEIINIIEDKASARGKTDYATFVKKVREEPNMREDRVRNFKEIGYYITEYEQYVLQKEQKTQQPQKKLLPFL